MSTAQAQRLMRAGEAARALGISAQRIFALGNKGVIAYTLDELTGWRVYDRAEVERLAEERAKRQRKSA